MKHIIKLFILLSINLIAFDTLFAKNYLDYATDYSDSNLNKIVSSRYYETQETCENESPFGSIGEFESNCFPRVIIVAPSQPEYHYFYNDVLSSIIKYEAKSVNGRLQISKPSLTNHEKALHSKIRESREEFAAELLEFARGFEEEHGGASYKQRPALLSPEKVNTDDDDCTQGEGNESFDSAIDATRPEIDSWLQEQINAGTYPKISDLNAQLRSFGVGVEAGSTPNILVQFGFVFQEDQFVSIQTSDGGVVTYGFDSNGPYLDLANSYTPPMGEMNSRSRLSTYFQRDFNHGPIKPTKIPLTNMEDACLFDEYTKAYADLGLEIVFDLSGSEGYDAGQCIGASQTGQSYTFSYVVQSSRWVGNRLVITADVVTQTVLIHDYRNFCF